MNPKKSSLIILFIFIFSLAGCGPQIDSSDPNERIKAINQEKYIEQATLIRVATTDEFPNVRNAAILKIDDQETLIKIVSKKPVGFNSARDTAMREYMQRAVDSGRANPDAVKALKEGKRVYIDPFTSMIIDADIDISIVKMCCDAINRITDTGALKQIVVSEKFWSKKVQETAKNRIDTLETGKR